MKVSIIIPATDKDNKLSAVLFSAYLQNYKNKEVIVVNEGKERSKQRNIGIDRATGDYLMFVDSDQILQPGLVTECVEMIKTYDALYIPEFIVLHDWFAVVRNFERQFYNGTPVDCVRFVRARKCPRFNTRMSGPEDADFDRRVRGTRGITTKKFTHDDGVTLSSYIKKKAYYSKSMKKFKAKWPKDKVLDLKYRCVDVFINQGKWKRLLKHPLLTLGVIFILGIRGVIWFRSLSLPQE